MPAPASASSSRARKAPSTSARKASAGTASAPARKAAAKAATRPQPKSRPAAQKSVAAKKRTAGGAKQSPATTTPATKVKQKLVRDSFTMPQVDFDLIDALKARALKSLRPAKKSELLRAGLQALIALSDAQLKAALEGLVPLKPGRPKKQA